MSLQDVCKTTCAPKNCCISVAQLPFLLLSLALDASFSSRLRFLRFPLSCHSFSRDVPFPCHLVFFLFSWHLLILTSLSFDSSLISPLSHLLFLKLAYFSTSLSHLVSALLGLISSFSCHRFFLPFLSSIITSLDTEIAWLVFLFSSPFPSRSFLLTCFSHLSLLRSFEISFSSHPVFLSTSVPLRVSFKLFLEISFYFHLFPSLSISFHLVFPLTQEWRKKWCRKQTANGAPKTESPRQCTRSIGCVEAFYELAKFEKSSAKQISSKIIDLAICRGWATSTQCQQCADTHQKFSWRSNLNRWIAKRKTDWNYVRGRSQLQHWRCLSTRISKHTTMHSASNSKAATPAWSCETTHGVARPLKRQLQRGPIRTWSEHDLTMRWDRSEAIAQ